MSDLPIDSSLIGQWVRNPSCLQWGNGRVVAVQPMQVNGQPAQRVTIDFSVVGRKTVMVPPAQLLSPTPEPVREKGWLDTLGGSTLDDRLRKLPAGVSQVLGSPREKLLAILATYTFRDEPNSLLRWARAQVGVSDPLSHWSRDELGEAFRVYCNERDAELRVAAALYKQREGGDALRSLLNDLPADQRTEVDAALRKIV